MLPGDVGLPQYHSKELHPHVTDRTVTLATYSSVGINPQWHTEGVSGEVLSESKIVDSEDGVDSTGKKCKKKRIRENQYPLRKYFVSNYPTWNRT